MNIINQLGKSLLNFKQKLQNSLDEVFRTVSSLLYHFIPYLTRQPPLSSPAFQGYAFAPARHTAVLPAATLPIGRRIFILLPLSTYEPQYAQFANHQQKDVLYHAATR